MDPTIPVVIVTAGVLKGPIQDFLKRISGPAADEIGDWWRESIHEFRTRNASKVLARAEEMIHTARLEARQVPLRTLLPIMDGASKEDDPTLSERWSALLANAAGGTDKQIPPIFPATLAQLTPFDALVLTELGDSEIRGYPPDPLLPTGGEPPPRWGARREEIRVVLPSSSVDELEVALNTLSALGLIEHEPVVRSEITHGYEAVFLSGNSEFRLSALGKNFVSACSAPASANR
jgi:hypothetical protein